MLNKVPASYQVSIPRAMGYVIVLGRGVSMVTCEVAVVPGVVNKVTFGGVFCKVKIMMMSWWYSSI